MNLTMTQLLSIILGVIALFALIYGICVRAKTLGLIGAVLSLVAGYLIWMAWWSEQLVGKIPN